MTEYDVELDHVTKRFDDVTAVDDVSFDIEEGKFLTLLGPSGCGKTTTLRCIAGFETPTEGEVRIDGKRVNEIPPFERETSMVFQSYALFPHMTVHENVAFGLQMKGIPGEDGSEASHGVSGAISNLVKRHGSEEIDDRVERMLDLVELPGMGDRNVDELSGGQQQRVALARALVTEPTVLLLDEPLGALDLKLRKNMQVELKNLQQELGITFVYVTHDQEEALTMSDEIAVMNEGRVAQLGTATEIYEEPASEFVADFIGETNLIRGEYAETDEGATITAGDLTFSIPPTEGASGEVAFAIRPEKIRVGDEAASQENHYTATVTDEIYKGNIGKFVMTLENDQELTVDMQIRDQGQYLSTGKQVEVGWSTENCVVLTK